MKMKHILVGLMMLCFQSAKAQLTLHSMIGGSMNTIYLFDASSKSNEGIKYLLGYQGGVGLDIPVGEVLSIEPILKYTQKGYSTLEEYEWSPGVILTEKTSFRIHYLELPVMFNINSELDHFKMVYSVGPYVSYGLDARFISEKTDGSTTETYDTKNRSGFYSDLVEYGYLNRIDFGLILGVRAEISNFTIGLTGAMSGQNFSGDLMSEANKNLNYQLNIGYKIEL